jgi:hypothetical protein
MVTRHDRLTKALAAGDLSARNARVLAPVVTADRLEVFDRDLHVLADTATAVAPDQLRLVTRRWASYADDHIGRHEPARLHAHRGLWHHRFGNLAELVVRGPHDDLATLLAHLDRSAPPDPTSRPGGPRSLAQRRYDALTHLNTTATTATPTTGRHPDHTLDIIVDLQTLTGKFNPTGRCATLAGDPVELTTAQRLACDSWLARVILAADGEVLQLGRRTRLFSPAQRRALLIEHGGCAICGAPPQWCDIHHLDPFQPAGSTDTTNGLPLCRTDHTRIHEGGWTLTRTPTGQWTIHPP